MQRVLLLTTPNTYRALAFVAAAERLGVDVVTATDMPAELAESWSQQLGLDFQQLDQAVSRIAAFAARRPLDAIISVDDSGSLLAARASAALGLPHNSVEAATAARDKHRMRALAAQLTYPCVIKPLHRSASQGVMRADDPEQCCAAIARLTRLLLTLDPA